MRVRPSRVRGLNKVMSAAAFLCVMAWLWGCRQPKDVAAQAEAVVWSEPIQLSNPGDHSWAPAIAADAAGNVHVMWSQTVTSDLPFGEGDTLFYTRWDGTEWSPKVDVLVSPFDAAQFPDLAVTPDGILHAVWNTGGQDSQLMYAQAPACCADHPRSWSQPISLGMPVDLTTALVADDCGRLHAAFASRDGGHIVYRRSDDGGATWPVWVDIVGGVHDADEHSAYPRLAVDGRGRVHAVWTVLPWAGRRVMYARSDDGGDNWNDLQVVDSADRAEYEAGYGPILIDVETYGDAEIHFIWNGAPTVERNHIWSSDGGETWSEPDLLIPELTRVGRSGWNDMAVDSAGTLHAVALGQPWHSSWSAGAWSSSTPLASGQEAGNAEWMRIALSLGNQLHVVWVNKGGEYVDSVWHAQGETTAQAIIAEPTSVPDHAPTFTPVGSAPTFTELPTLVPSTRSQLRDEMPPVKSRKPMDVVFVGAITASLVVGIVLAMSIRQTHRSRRH